MSIATVGPKKYDFQDMVCVFLYLRFERLSGVTLYAEPSGGEDARITHSNYGSLATIDIQVKGSQDNVTVSDVAEWLSHFPERNSSGSLLERLINEPDTSAVFVASGRCVDALDRLVKRLKDQWSSHSDKIKRIVAEELLGEIERYADRLAATGKDLSVERSKHLKMFCRNTRPDVVRGALVKLTIVERVDDAELDYWCVQELRSKRLPLDRCEDVILRMRELVKAGKESKLDITPSLNELLHGSLPECIRPKEYRLRGAEDFWIKELGSENALLLSGSPRVGKSNAGRWIAAEFEQMGYEVRRTRDLEEVGRFLLAPGDSERLALVDDPLGSTTLIGSAARALSHLRQLLPNMSASRKIIVCQVQDLLFEASQAVDLRDAHIGKHKWHDLGEFSTDFATKLWNDLCVQFEVPEQLQSLICRALQSDVYLEPGCLLHLAASKDRLSDLADIEAAIRLAREDSKDLARSLKEEGHSAILQVLSVATSPDNCCGEEDLRFLLNGDDSEFKFAKADVSGVGVTFGAKLRSEQNRHESYGEISTLSEANIVTISSLEARRIILENESGQHNFSHPFYRSAAKNTLNGAVTLEAKNVIKYLERGIFSLSSDISKSAAGALDWVFSAVKSQPRRAEIVALAIEGLDSRYLTTRDRCFDFLLDHVDYLEAEQADFSTWVSKVSWIRLNHVLWEKGEAVLPAGKTMTLNGRYFETYTLDQVKGAVDSLNENAATPVSSESAWKVICYLESCAGSISKLMLMRLLSYDLGLMRAGASKLWISMAREEDDDALDKIFSDRHPAVVRATLEAVLDNWSELLDERRSKLLALLKKNAWGATSAVVIMPVLLQGKINSEVLVSLLPNVFRALPQGVRVDSSKLFYRVMRAAEFLPVSGVIEIIDGWIDFLEGLVQRAFPSDYLMGVTQIILERIPGGSGVRLSRLRRLAYLKSTVARIRLVIELVDNWQLLLVDEREYLASLITEESSDRKWLQAAAVTRSTVPQKLAALVFQGGIMPDACTVEVLDSELIEFASRLYMGTYDIPSQVSAERRGCKIWEPIIESYALNPRHVLFEESWEHLARDTDDAKMANLVRILASENPQAAFERLFYHKVRTCGDFMPLTWEALLDKAPADKLDAWLELMAQHSNVILENLGEIDDWIGEKYTGVFLTLFGADVAVLSLAHNCRAAYSHCIDERTGEYRANCLSMEVREALLAMTLERIENSPPRHHSSCDAILNILRKLDFSDEQLMPIQELRSRLSDSPRNLIGHNSLKIERIDGWLLPKSFNQAGRTT